MANSDQIKVVLLGESGVGKTCIVQSFAYDKYKEDSAPTLGAMFVSKILEMPNSGANVKFQIWDTAGQEKYRSLAAMYYQDAKAAILVYDITKKASFEGINYWITELKSKAPEGIKIAIAANKADLVEQEAVNSQEAKQFANDNKAIFKMTSAKDGMGIIDLFVDIATSLGKGGATKMESKIASTSVAPGKMQKEEKGTKLKPIAPTDKKEKKKCC